MASFPLQWWKGRPLILAHRGANLQAPENTLPAFRTAIQIGADGIELDVRLSADGVPVVIHDSHVDSTTDGHGAIDTLTLTEIKELDAGSWFCDSCTATIPTLEEVFDELGGKTIINIELKGNQRNDHSLAESVCSLITKMAVQESVWFSSFKPSLLRQTRKILPFVPNGYLYTIPSPIHSLNILTTPIEAVHPYFRTISRKYVERMHGLNKRVIVWTVDDAEVAEHCIEAKIDALITNDPEQLLQILV